MHNKTLLLIIIFVSNFFQGQDSIRIDSELSIETKGQHNLSAIAKDAACVNCPADPVNDNPFFHLTIYT